MPQTRIFKLRRVRGHASEGHHTLFFMTEGASRSRPPKFFEPEDVPEFEAEEAWFEAELVPRQKPRILRQVPSPCPYEAAWTTADLANRFAQTPNRTLTAIASRMRCARCRQRNVRFWKASPGFVPPT